MKTTRLPVLILMMALGPFTSFAGQGKLYWTDTLTDKIQRANLDGSGIEDVLSIDSPRQIEIDTIGEMMYWVSSYPLEGLDRVHRADLNGSNLETLHEVTTVVLGLALNLSAGKLYWTTSDCPGNSKVMRSDLDGSNVEEIVTGQDRAGEIDLDVADDRMLWAGGDECSQDDPGYSTRISRATLDGGGIQSFIVNELGVGALALDPAQDVVYWSIVTDCQPCSNYFRASYNGSGRETLIVDWFSAAGIALDVPAGKMYFGSGPWIWRASLDGTSLTELVDDLGAVTGVALGSPGEPVPATSRNGVLAAVLMLLAGSVVLFRYGRP